MKKKSLLPLGLAIGLASLAASPLIQARDRKSVV